MSRVLAVSDLHLGHPGNRDLLDRIRPTSRGDWLIVAGDVAEKPEAQRRALATLRERFEKVVWVPGNHDLWTTARDPVSQRGEGRYRRLVEICREIDVVTPEDRYPVWSGPGGPAVLAPMFLLYDYTFLPRGARTKDEGLALAEARGTVATDEQLLDPAPYESREEWCRRRVDYTRRRLDALDPAVPMVLINHFPLVRGPVERLLRAEFAMWCGTELTAEWHRRYDVRCVVYGHLHLRRTDYFDGVRFEEVSVGYPREWRTRGLPDPLLRQIVPEPADLARPAGGLGRRSADRAVRLARSMARRASVGK
ncbi:metallophosphoesterase family protein [Nocardia amikacinitolerans]|uniref:metallophosphoesterase family protein n=1 Tax=Nocardia amikacinitolerans TaxID=756689 RepID=UPI0020A234F7|nr:metallophosphoesterase [Nocardia amikacinitolerans]MCP2275882.1 3',5'-cyclic AMP phosphodiesterase CpdA [Nocardia amikacinitolerans]MCP2294153.1 3',5'-cyclic AMP phosphodiesterase CpdA [Nocardia amikacinitolerans]